MKFKWLHLSDFHTGKDTYVQIKLFGYILEHLKEKKQEGIVPDAIFITGDISNEALEDQFLTFNNEFLLPLCDIFDPLPPIYIIPGNHDVDRTQSLLAANSFDNLLNHPTNFFDTNKQGIVARREIFGRFEKFKSSFANNFCYSVDDLFTEKACFCDVIQKGSIKIGVIGLNTAWLSHSDSDCGNLTPGVYVVEDAANNIKDCNYRIVLGHHPLSCYQIKQRQRITSIFAKNKVIYLHGHMHKNSNEYVFSADNGFLTIQSGAAFQAREDELYYNSILWGELDSINNTIVLVPKKWSTTNYKFIPDSSDYLPEYFRIKGTDKWELPLFFSVSKEGHKLTDKIPAGWCLVNNDFINSRKESPPSDAEILKYYDGKEPTYHIVFSSKIPRRSVVDTIKDEFTDAADNKKIQCTLITGAGGEGKTTAFLQVVQALVEEYGWKGMVLNQTEPGITFPSEKIINIVKEGTWIIAIDNANIISDDIFGFIKKCALKGCFNVHVLMCARDVDWDDCDANKFDWNNYSNFSIHRMRGISPTDAEIIVSGWSQYGEIGLGKLKNLNISEAKEKLVLASMDQEKTDPEEGAFLGAMLETRYGNDLKYHISKILTALQSIKVFEGNLLDIFAYIVAMHSEKQYFLSKTVLAHLLNCDLKTLKKKVIKSLGDEAVSATNGDMIFTRHLSIAKSARTILENKYLYDFDQIFIDLTAAAIEAWQKGEYVEQLGKWRYISDYFFNKGETTLAIRIDKELLHLDKTDAFTIVHLSRLYRSVSQPDLALRLFHDISYVVEDRPFFCEWALAEANEENKVTSICLSAVALSDQVEKKPVNVKNACINLYSIAITFFELYSEYNSKIYLFAALASITIGLKINNNDNNLQLLYQDKADLFNAYDSDSDNFPLITEHFINGINTADKENETQLADWIPYISSLTFNRLFALAGISLVKS